MRSVAVGDVASSSIDEDFVGRDVQIESGFDEASPGRGRVKYRGASGMHAVNRHTCLAAVLQPFWHENQIYYLLATPRIDYGYELTVWWLGRDFGHRDLSKTARVVPQREQFVVERLGKYSKTLDAGFHILVPFVDSVAYRHTLKEQTFDVASQSCITQDNIAVEIDGVIYMQVSDARAASYGIEDYRFAVSQLAQTTLRSEIGKIELDRTFEERETINAQVVDAVDRAAEPWGVKILRYEIKDIVPPDSVKDALEKQMRAERERRAVVAESEGERQARINVSEGDRQEAINLSRLKNLSRLTRLRVAPRKFALLLKRQHRVYARSLPHCLNQVAAMRLICVLQSSG